MEEDVDSQENEQVLQISLKGLEMKEKSSAKNSEKIKAKSLEVFDILKNEDVSQKSEEDEKKVEVGSLEDQKE